MTREDAIKELKEDIELYIPLNGTIDDLDRDLPDGRLITALEMAIKALEQEPCEDAINREDAMMCMTRKYAADMTCDPEDIISKHIRRLRALPPVQPKPETGHWVLTDVEGNRIWHCSCSECGKDPQNYIGGSENWWLIKNNLPKFCPNCGADMREEKR